jgi:hypothetical protein
VSGLGIEAEAVDFVDVNLLISNAVAVLVHPSERLVEEAGLRISLRHRPLEDVQLVLAHCDERHRPRLIGVVGQMDLVTFDEILPVPQVMRDRRVTLDELERRIHKRPADVLR